MFKKDMKHCVIFDMDGVIIDSEPIHLNCEQKMFRMLKINVSDEVHNAMVGSTDETMWSSLAKSYELPVSVPEAIQLKKSLYLEYLKNAHISPIPYVSELIAALYEKGFTLVLASSSPKEQIQYILSNFKLIHYFKFIISGEDVDEGKPHPGIFLKAAESVGIKTDSCVVIEDSYNGVVAAKSAGMKCIAYRNINSGNQDLSRADKIIDSFRDISVMNIMRVLEFKEVS